jgi:hypothetical protein
MCGKPATRALHGRDLKLPYRRYGSLSGCKSATFGHFLPKLFRLSDQRLEVAASSGDCGAGYFGAHDEFLGVPVNVDREVERVVDAASWFGVGGFERSAQIRDRFEDVAGLVEVDATRCLSSDSGEQRLGRCSFGL